MVAWARFVGPFAGANVLIMATYWIAQSMIAASFIGRRDIANA
jgi:hypothetical protein